MIALLRLLPGLCVGILYRSTLYLSIFCFPTIAFAQLSRIGPVNTDQAMAARALGGQWKQMARRAGMIFAGTVLGYDPPAASADLVAPIAATLSASSSTIELRFRVERAIAGVELGQVLTIHEWTGVSSVHRPMKAGQHVLLFLYPVSRLGFTSPVGGAAGEVLLDASGKYLVEPTPAAHFRSLNAPELSSPFISSSSHTAATRAVSLDQLERAVRGVRQAREE